LKNRIIATFFSAAAMFLASSAYGQWAPVGPVELIVAAGSGGGNDRTARLLANMLTGAKLVQAPVVVVNKPGAGGVIAQNYLNSHRGNGHYLMITNPALLTNPIIGVGTAKYTEVTPVAQLFNEYVLLVAKSSAKVETGKDLIASWKRSPTSLSLAVAPGLGAGPHIAAAMVAQTAGVDPSKLVVVPYVTAAAALTALLGGHVDLMASTTMNVLPFLVSGKVHALGITGPQRIPGQLASVPTWREQGVDVEFGNWRGVVGPDGMTKAQITYWESVFSKLVALPEWKARVDEEFSQGDYKDSAASKLFLDQENQRLGQLLKRLGLATSK